MRVRAGFTLVELLVVLVMTVVLAIAIGIAFSAEATTQRLDLERQANVDQTNKMETEITRMLLGARLSTSTTDTTSYFQGVNDAGGSALGCDRITFTTTVPGVPYSAYISPDDFETQQQDVGEPIGGLTEVSLGCNPVGNAGSQTGLFERIQRPSDADPTQGGYESCLDPDIATIGFQFWDGTEWIQAWDTTTGSRRMPAAVQVSYTLKNTSDNTPHMFVVSIPSSDVTALNPYNSTSTTTTTGTGTTTP